MVKGQRGDGSLGTKLLQQRFKGVIPKANRPLKKTGKLVSQPDEYEGGQYKPWARGQKIGSVKEVTFDPDGRRGYLSGFRKRKQERKGVAKKKIVDKEKTERRAAKRQKKREMLDAYEERMQKMREFESEVAFTGSDASEDDDDDDDDDDDGTRGERGAGSVAAAHGPSKMTFGDREEGTASVVEVEEMDLSSLSRQSVSATLLPALPPAEGPMSKRLKKKIKGPQRRQQKKDKLQKSKRDKRKGRVKKD